MALTEGFASRELVLRTAHFMGAAAMVAIFFAALPRLNTARAEAARSEAELFAHALKTGLRSRR